MTDTIDIYNQEQITAALGAIKTALDSLISAGIPVDLTGYVRLSPDGGSLQTIDGHIDVTGDLATAGELQADNAEVTNGITVGTTALIGESTIVTGANLAVSDGIAVTNGAGIPTALILDNRSAMLMQGAYSAAKTVVDDDIFTIDLYHTGGMAIINDGGGYAPTHCALISYQWNNDVATIILQTGSVWVTTTAELTQGTSDGTDGNLNFSTYGTGKVTIKNRTGGIAYLVVTIASSYSL